jgi:hypothetical protein
MIVDLLSVIGVIVSGAVAGFVVMVCRGGRCSCGGDSE